MVLLPKALYAAILRDRYAGASGVKSLAALIAMLAILAAGVVRAVDDMALEIERIDGAGWSAEGVVLQLDLPRGAMRAHATVSRLNLASPARELRDVSIDCRTTEISDATIVCRDARIDGTLPSIGVQRLSGHIVYGRRDGALDVSLAGLRIGKGSANVEGSMNTGGWRTRVRLDGVDVERAVALAREWQLPVPELTATGVADVSLTAHGAGSDVREATVQARFDALTANNESGSLAAEKLGFELQGKLERLAQGWRFDADVKSAQGQAYAQPIFLDLGAHALEAQAHGRWMDDGTLHLEAFQLDHRDVARGRGSATLKFDEEQPIRALALDLDRLQFPGAYASYFQPLLLDTSFKAMESAGAISGRIVVAAGMPERVDLKFDGVTVDDGSGTFSLTGLRGDWHWLDDERDAHDDDEADSAPAPAKAADSTLGWRDGSMLNLELGAASLHFNTHGRQFRLLEPVKIPVFDGAVELESFRVRNAGEPSVAFLVDATIEPISVQELCKAFGWPEFGGRISGAISKLRMREGVITLGTTLEAQVLGGNVTIKDLRLEQPFSKWPRFHAGVALRNLDLELVTSAFSFGRITGRLSGDIKGLELFNWTPVAFDARLYTPPDDRSPHRISQRAVENIGSMGGGAGVGGALSSGFLRFFDDFNYDKLGLSCRLERNVCLMNGVAPAPDGGYYLVKGKGLPRIDVIGGARRVDWPRLVQQLIAVTESGGPVVK